MLSTGCQLSIVHKYGSSYWEFFLGSSYRSHEIKQDLSCKFLQWIFKNKCHINWSAEFQSPYTLYIISSSNKKEYLPMYHIFVVTIFADFVCVYIQILFSNNPINFLISQRGLSGISCILKNLDFYYYMITKIIEYDLMDCFLQRCLYEDETILECK